MTALVGGCQWGGGADCAQTTVAFPDGWSREAKIRGRNTSSESDQQREERQKIQGSSVRHLQVCAGAQQVHRHTKADVCVPRAAALT